MTYLKSVVSKVLFTLLLMISVNMKVGAADLSVSAGEVTARTNEWGHWYYLSWPKSGDDRSVGYAYIGVAFGGVSSTTLWRFTDYYTDWDGFYTDTSLADQEARGWGVYEMRANGKYHVIRQRTVVRAWSTKTKENQVDIAVEAKNLSEFSIDDFYTGVKVYIDTEGPWTAWDYYIDDDGYFQLEDTLLGEAHYLPGSQAFWFGVPYTEDYPDTDVPPGEEDGFYCAFVCNLGKVHTAKMTPDYISMDHGTYSAGTEPDDEDLVFEDEYWVNPDLFFSVKENVLVPNERAYMRVTLAFAYTKEEILGKVSGTVLAAGTVEDPDLDYKLGRTDLPEFSTNNGGGGGCVLKPTRLQMRAMHHIPMLRGVYGEYDPSLFKNVGKRKRAEEVRPPLRLQK
ncbi:MAG: hypothetical protein HQL32_11170 [Planctomycetes bacterium]|nr:hypothetical protein [Planctomycetota bacterium]